MATENEQITIVDNPAENRFEATVDGRLSVAQYVREGQTIIFTHTEVPPELRGRGIAGALARAALDNARAQGLVVDARCKVIAHFVETHPEYKSLLRQPTSQP